MTYQRIQMYDTSSNTTVSELVVGDTDEEAIERAKEQFPHCTNFVCITDQAKKLPTSMGLEPQNVEVLTMAYDYYMKFINEMIVNIPQTHHNMYVDLKADLVEAQYDLKLHKATVKDAATHCQVLDAYKKYLEENLEKTFGNIKIALKVQIKMIELFYEKLIQFVNSHRQE